MKLAENHERHVLSTFQYVDRLFADMEQVLSIAQSSRLYKEYESDVAPEKQAELRRAITEFRALMSQIQEELNIASRPPNISAARAVLTSLTFIEIALEELQARHMRGYGELSASTAVQLEAVVAQMQSILERMRSLFG